jgi:predicted  nucleic acid-binding Zn-ribbon protein
MFERLEKYRAELERAKARRAELDARVKELERKCKEEENAQIHGMVHAMNMTPEQLQKILASVSEGKLPGILKDQDDYDDDLEQLEAEIAADEAKEFEEVEKVLGDLEEADNED